MKTTTLIPAIIVASLLPLTADINPGEYPDKNIAPLGEEEAAVLTEIDGQWKHTAAGLEITLPSNKPCEHAYSFKIN